ncbi:arabinosyltransferase domain-containing protein [Nocardia ignorata]|uniref:arabinosyltransferase domain-containing protein n=1 Tax=Nocardia ignorata TaxID=145285 RepID=UPI001FB8006A|nr:arabinosyltransferase domain-containing protein [Nocardia ignorata]
MGGDSGFGRAKIGGIVAGALGLLLAVLVPLLPVQQQRASLDWPQDKSLQVSAPLVDYVPLSLDLRIPCTALQGFTGGTVLSTVPPQAPRAGSKGLVARIEDRPDQGRTLSMVLRDRLLLSVPLTSLPTGPAAPGVEGAPLPSAPAAPSGAPSALPESGVAPGSADGRCALVVFSDAGSTSAEIVGVAARDGAVMRTAVQGDVRPQVVGVFTELDRGRLGDARLHAEIDARFSSSPSGWKLAAIIGAVLCTLLALICLHRSDLRDGRRTRRLLPMGWWRFRAVDATVAGVLAVWHVIGANSSDDGYILTMARSAREAGYTANYYRWFQVAEAPFGWPYEVLAWMSRVSEAGVWMRLPALLAGLVCWLVLSREVLPRLGIAANRWAVWTGALVFLSIWLPYNNGLRPEPLIAVGALVTWCSMERAVATRRLMPAAVAVLVAAFSLAAGPTGLICTAALLAASRPVIRTIVARSGSTPSGYATLLAPIAAAGTLVLVVVFADQTLATVLEATRVRQLVGPDMSWFEERTRWDTLLSVNPDGSLARRFGILAMLLCLIIGVLTTLRHGRVPRTARGPVTRLLAVVFMALLLMMFTPTKWTHHFGVYAGLAAALAAVTAVALNRRLIHATYVRTLFTAAVLFLLAVSLTGSNGWWYVSGYGVPWPDRAPTLGSVSLSTLALTATAATLLLALYQYYREPRPREGGTQTPAGDHHSQPRTSECETRRDSAEHDNAPADSQRDDHSLSPEHDGQQAVDYPRISERDNPVVDKHGAPLLDDENDGEPRATETDRRLPFAGKGSAAGRFKIAPVAPLTLVAAALVLFEVGSLASAAVSQYPAYSVGLSNLRALGGNPCAMADDVLVETNTADSLLTPYTGTIADSLAAENTGFTPNGVGSLAPDPGPGQSSAPPSGSGPGGGGPGSGPGGAPSGPNGEAAGSPQRGPGGGGPGAPGGPAPSGSAGPPSAGQSGAAPGGPTGAAPSGPNGAATGPAPGGSAPGAGAGPSSGGPSGSAPAGPIGATAGPPQGSPSGGGPGGGPSGPAPGSPAPSSAPGGGPGPSSSGPTGAAPGGQNGAFPGGQPSGNETPRGANGGPAGAPGGPSDGPSAAAGPGNGAPAGVNGSTVALPFGLAPERTPVLGSYAVGAPRASKLVTQWFRMDLAAVQRDPAYRVLILTVAGRIEGVGPDGAPMPGQRLRVEFGREAGGTFSLLGEATPPSVGGAPGWRNLPVSLDGIPLGTNAVRLITEGDPDPMQWVALTPPRLPKLTTLNTMVGEENPVLADWHVGLAFPCQRPFDHRAGVAEMPIWRILPDKLNAQVSETWQGDTGGGPLGWTGMLMRSQTIPSYLADDWTRDWGELQRLTRLITAPPAEITIDTEPTWGWSTAAPIRTN